MKCIVYGCCNQDHEGEFVGSMCAGESTPVYETQELQKQLSLQFEELQSVIYARRVQKVGDRRYWEQWAKDVATIAERQIERISYLVQNNQDQGRAFDAFLEGLQKNINPSISKQEAIEMLAQHIITQPVFEALFENYSFQKNNAVSHAMQAMLDSLEGESIADDSDNLQKFYDSVRKRAEGIDNAEGKQRIIIELYDKFFKTAFPKMVEQLGIVYTPVEVVDFIIHSVNDVLKKEFGRSLSDDNIHILDPFTGTGTFITRLIQSGLINKEKLAHKYKHEIHANEIVLLAYYIATVNIENAYHDYMQSEKYESFDGIVLTDTFQMGETEDSQKLFSEMFAENSERVVRQKKAPLRVIIGNPPYSIGQRSANDNAQNQSYPILDSRIANTYAKESNAGLNKSLYDSYIKAFRWSTDRLDPKHGGIVAFITNSGWLDSNSADGFRKIIEKEFNSIYIFDLKGAIRGKAGTRAKKEGQNIFNIMTGVAITLLVKSPVGSNKKAKVYYHDIGDYLNRNDKLRTIKDFKSIQTVPWKELKPNEHGDWIHKRSDNFETYIPLAPEKKFDTRALAIFNTYSLGIATNKDAWLYNFSENKLKSNLKRMISFYNEQRIKFNTQTEIRNAKDFVEYNAQKINWTDMFLNDLSKNIEYVIDEDKFCNSLYRPYSKTSFCYEKQFVQRTYQQTTIFPTVKHTNLVICVSQRFIDGSVLITNVIPDLHFNGDTQAFPLYYYEEQIYNQNDLFQNENTEHKFVRKDGVSDFILERCTKQYGKNITKEDIFYYVYGFLHSPDYRLAFANDLKKMLPRLPLVDDVRDFWAFSKAGKKLAELHLKYEEVPAYPNVEVIIKAENYTVQKMRFPKKDQKSSIIYNSAITINNIPTKAYEYVVNGKSAIEWIMKRYQITTDTKSGITNDPNDWAKEHNKPRYILDLLLSIINLSVQTVDIVENLPKVNFEIAKKRIEQPSNNFIHEMYCELNQN